MDFTAFIIRFCFALFIIAVLPGSTNASAEATGVELAVDKEPTVKIPVIRIGKPEAGDPDEKRIQSEKSEQSTRPLYGDDDRMDWGKIKKDEKVRARAAASAALFSLKEVVTTPDGKTKTSSAKISEAWELCDTERFAKQVTGAFCSGTLIGDDLVLTAGHCVRESSKNPEVPLAKDILFVFGYYAENMDSPGRTTFESRQVYRGKEFVDGILKAEGGRDWSIVRLERRVPKTIAKPVTALRKDKITIGTKVYVLGYPSGLPLKMAGGAKVTKNDAAAFFAADLDTFGGNSGSGVFDEQSHELVGVLVRGDTDYYTDRKKHCRRAYRCPAPPNGCNGEDVTRIETVKMP